MLNTKHLKVFAAVARCGSVTHASGALQRAQSAVSRSIKELEASLGTELFERHPRGLLLTDFGRTLLHRTDIAFKEMQQAKNLLAQHHAGGGARLLNAPVFTLSVHERHLRLLIVFSELRYMGSVALALGVSQPAVSMALRDLEASVGLPLFDRSHAGVRLSVAGEVLLLHVKRALTQLRIAGEEIAALKGVIQGQVTVGALPFGRPYMLPVAIGSLLKRHPKLHVRTVEGPLEALMAGLRSGDVDLVVGALPPVEHHRELVREELFEESMTVMARANHPLTAGRARALKTVLREAWVLPRRGTPSRDVLSVAFAKLGLEEPHVAVESSDLSVIRGLLLETDMISAASRHLFHHELSNGLLVALPMNLPGTSRTIGILRRTLEHSSPIAQLLISELRAVRKPANDY